MNIFQERLREMILKNDDDISINIAFGWCCEWELEWRRLLFKCLIKDQIKSLKQGLRDEQEPKRSSS